MVMPQGRSVSKAVLRSLWFGFVGGLFMELWLRLSVILGVLSESFHWFALIAFWFIYTNFFYYLSFRDAENKLWHDVIASLVFALALGAATALMLFLQGFGFTRPALWVFGLSTAVGSISGFFVWLQQRFKK